MTTKRLTPFTVGQGFVGLWAGSVLVEVDARFVPTLIHRIEVYKLAFVYQSEGDRELGYQFHVKQQEALLMDATDRIVSEVRALREGSLTDPAMQDPQLDPFTLPLTSLADITASVDRIGQEVIPAELATTNGLLTEIRDAVLAGGNPTEVLDRLDILIALLGAV